MTEKTTPPDELGAVPCSALELAIRFHETYERLAPAFGYETRLDTRAFDPASKNGKLMVAVCAVILEQNASGQVTASEKL
jgi:hypothetical protein